MSSVGNSVAVVRGTQSLTGTRTPGGSQRVIRVDEADKAAHRFQVQVQLVALATQRASGKRGGVKDVVLICTIRVHEFRWAVLVARGSRRS